MKKFFIFLTLILILIGCNKNNYDEFNFSFQNTFEIKYSIKFNKSDTVYVKVNWSANKKFPEGNYFALIPKNQKQKIDEEIKKLDFSKLDSIYFEDYEDGDAYNFFYKKDNFEKKIKIHSNNPPKEIVELENNIDEEFRKLKLERTSIEKKYKSIFKEILPPPAPN